MPPRCYLCGANLWPVVNGWLPLFYLGMKGFYLKY